MGAKNFSSTFSLNQQRILCSLITIDYFFHIFRNFAETKNLFACVYLSFTVWFPLSFQHWSSLLWKPLALPPPHPHPSPPPQSCEENLAYLSPYSEMEFVDINFTKDSSLLLHAIHRLSTGRILKKPDSTLVLKIHTKNPQNKKNWVCLWIASCWKGKKRVENQSRSRIPSQAIQGCEIQLFSYAKLRRNKFPKRLFPFLYPWPFVFTGHKVGS